MKKIFFIALCLSIITYSNAKIRVGVFDGYGGAESCKMETLEALKLDKEIAPRMITTSDIAGGVLDSLDAIIIPGGGGSRQYMNLGYSNREKIVQFIKSGKGAVGICAGAYLFSATPKYACMSINGACAIDLKHDNRGHGLVKITLSDEGKEIFPEIAKRDTTYIVYYEGPVFVKEKNGIPFKTFATMHSDVHEEGNAPSNMTNNRPFFIGNTLGKGRIFSTIAHPEATPGMHWMIPRMVRWTLKKPYQLFSKNVIRPNLYNKEILFTKGMLKKESDYYQTLLYGSESEKIKALDWLEENISWDAKRWIQGLLFDKSPKVRARASEYIARSGFTHYLPDLEVAYKNETEASTKAIMDEALNFLKGL